MLYQWGLQSEIYVCLILLLTLAEDVLQIVMSKYSK